MANVKHANVANVQTLMMTSSSLTTAVNFRGSSRTRAHSRTPYVGMPTRQIADSHCEMLWAKVTLPYPSTESVLVMYGMVMTPISILDAVSIVFIMALNPTEWTNRAAIFEGFRSAQCLGMAMLECDKRHAVQGWRNTQQEHLRAFDFGDFR